MILIKKLLEFDAKATELEFNPPYELNQLNITWRKFLIKLSEIDNFIEFKNYYLNYFPKESIITTEEIDKKFLISVEKEMKRIEFNNKIKEMLE